MKSTNPFAASPPGTTIANWRAANYASSGGVAATGVYKDFNLVNVNMARDAGAVNH
jgi:hypothetical protein